MQVKVSIRLHRPEFVGYKSFTLDAKESDTLLELLQRIKEEWDESISFRSMCRAGICGTCGVKANGKHVLACSTKVFSLGEDITIEPVDKLPVIKDLIVEHGILYSKLKSFKVWLEPYDKMITVFQEDVEKIEKSTECILCGICDSVCPVLDITQSFAGPMSLTRYYKLLQDTRNSSREKRSVELQTLNPQLCTHCMNCSYACPKKLMPEFLIKQEESLLYEKGILQKSGGDFGFLSF